MTLYPCEPPIYSYIYLEHPSSYPSISSTLCHSTPFCLSFRLSICFFISVPSIIYPSVDLKIDSAVYHNVNHLHLCIFDFDWCLPFPTLWKIYRKHTTLFGMASLSNSDYILCFRRRNELI